MSNRLRIQEFMVITAGGVPIFHYSPINVRRFDELLSGFLSAISSFATEFGEKSVQSLSFEGSEVLYEQPEGEEIFLFLVDTGAPTRLLRAVLKDLSRKFTTKYNSELERGTCIEEEYSEFRHEVERAMTFYQGVLQTTSSLTSFVVPVIRRNVLQAAIESEGLLDEFHRDFAGTGRSVLDAIDGQSTINAISERIGIEEEEVTEVIEYLAIWGVLEVMKLCPLLKENDSRFDAYLDLVGLPRRDYQLLKRAKPLCNGQRTIEEIAERLGVTSERVHEVLEKLGDEVDWKLVGIQVIPRHD
ncbi:hypothetical protein EU545_03280 [Candidatus Thorarchaeota archaeon]|nr:MAG: hypothetical protein EU545_03280 [Candidatus Thorarchaeota archaeon]